MRKSFLVLLMALGANACEKGADALKHGPESEPWLIAHRGASAYAPEHTIAAYQLALDQGADFIEPDLQITKDGHLIALHDATLERTTDVSALYPERYREEARDDGLVRRWYASDFTLSEIKRLDAGSWFGPEFLDARIPTLGEVIELARGKAGVFPETKAPEAYSELGFEMERLLVAELRRYGLDQPDVDPSSPVVIQSFSAESLLILRDELGSNLPRILLLSGSSAEEWTSEEGMARVAEFAAGIGPAKRLLIEDPAIMERAKAAGLLVTPWTFGATEVDDFGELKNEMIYFLCDLGVNGLFTNNPDLFPRPLDCG